MDSLSFRFHGTDLTALPSGALWWEVQRTLIVADLHLGKSERIARRGGTPLPPYDTHDTLARLRTAIKTHQPTRVICLGDSFDDSSAASALSPAERKTLTDMTTTRDWIWITGNHDPAPQTLPGRVLDSLSLTPLHFRHIADPTCRGELSGHYHPKAAIPTRARRITWPAFLIDAERVILPAFGTYTGGLHCSDPALTSLMQPDAQVILTGYPMLRLPMPCTATLRPSARGR